MYIRTTLVLCLCLGSFLNADSINRSSNNSASTVNTTISNENSITINSRLNVEEELAKIGAICLTTAEIDQLTGSIVKDFFAAGLASIVLKESVVSIGLAELRAALKFSPLPPWGSYNVTKPSEEDLLLAPTPEAYYELKEPKTKIRSLDSLFLYERNLAPGIKFLDVRIPEIRALFKRTFEEKLQSEAVIDKKIIDEMFNEYSVILGKIKKKTEETHNPYSRTCEKD